MKWISVKDKLPEVYMVRYLTYIPCPWQKHRLFIIQDRYYSTPVSWELEGVTHWMPLPEPPEAKIEKDTGRALEETGVSKLMDNKE